MGVAHAGELLAFADAALSFDPEMTAKARGTLLACMDEAAMIDAAAVIAGFNGITRIADATGIPLEPEKVELTAAFFDTLDIGRFRREKT